MNDNIKQMAELIAENLQGYVKEILTMEEASKYIGIQRGTLYQMISKKQIPYYKPTNKLIFFLREDINKWIMQNRIASETELNNKSLNK